MSNYYEELGVARDANLRQIQAAWRAAALKHSPDQGGDPDAFRRARVAYEVLSDSAQRELYDRTGSAHPDFLTRILGAVDEELLRARSAVKEGRYLDAAEHGIGLLRRATKRLGWNL